MVSLTGENAYLMQQNFWENIFHRTYYRIL